MAGVSLSVAVFLFFVIQVRSEEILSTGMSTEPTAVPAEAAATSTNQTTEPIVTEPLLADKTLLATSTTEYQSLDSSINSAASSSPAAAAISEPIPPPHIEKEFVLQPSVSLKIAGGSVNAEIRLQNLSCRSCAKQLKDTDVIAYYTSWYPNDGEVKEIGPRLGEQSFRVSNLANWGEYETTWAAAISPGRYYFVVLTDPANQNNIYGMYRVEFEILPQPFP